MCKYGDLTLQFTGPYDLLLKTVTINEHLVLWRVYTFAFCVLMSEHIELAASNIVSKVQVAL